MRNDFAFTTLKVESPKAGILQLTLHRPEALNALNETMLSELDQALGWILNPPSGSLAEQIKVLVITGNGEKAFVAGADIRAMMDLDRGAAQHFAERGQRVFQKLNQLPIPVIAAVNGFALGGGCELALSCDFIFAAENAKFGLPEVGLGLIPGFGGTVRLFQAVGLRKAREMIYSGDMLTATEAQQWGLVNKVVLGPELLGTVYKIAETIMTKAPGAVAAAKKSVNQAYDLSVEQALQNEAKLFADLFLGPDVREGTKAFVEKRKAQFSGR